MLILSTISLAFSAWGMFEVFDLVRYFRDVPIYASISLLSTATIPLGIVALVLLYQKRKLGLTLMLTSLGTNLVLGIASFFYSDQALRYLQLTSFPSDYPGPNDMDPTTLFSIAWYAIIILGSFFVIAAAVLWHYAWQNQQNPTKK